MSVVMTEFVSISQFYCVVNLGKQERKEKSKLVYRMRSVFQNRFGEMVA